jgi:soluble lytic murein transglycosylase-like protein
LKVPNLFSSSQVARGIAAATLVAALALSAGSIPIALADTIPASAPVATEASSVSTASVAASATTDATIAVPVVKPAPIAAPRKLTVRQVIAKVGHAAGLRQAQIDALMWIAKRESNFHPTSASSSGCYGLFQLSRGMAHGHPWKDPAWNTKRAIKYMRGRYGSVLKAKAFWLRHHWY